MNTNTHPPTRPGKRRFRAMVAIAGTTAVAVLATSGCSGSFHHSYRTFQSALDRGASCSELYDQRSRFENDETLAKIDHDLQSIGCTSPTPPGPTDPQRPIASGESPADRRPGLHRVHVAVHACRPAPRTYVALSSRPATSTRPSHAMLIARGHRSELVAPDSMTMSKRLLPSAKWSVFRERPVKDADAVYSGSNVVVECEGVPGERTAHRVRPDQLHRGSDSPRPRSPDVDPGPRSRGTAPARSRAVTADRRRSLPVMYDARPFSAQRRSVSPGSVTVRKGATATSAPVCVPRVRGRRVPAPRCLHTVTSRWPHAASVSSWRERSSRRSSPTRPSTRRDEGWWTNRRPGWRPVPASLRPVTHYERRIKRPARRPLESPPEPANRRAEQA